MKLFPKNALEKSAKNILSLVLLTLILSPFLMDFSHSFNMDFESPKIEIDNSFVITETIKVLEENVEAYLREQNYAYYDVKIKYREKEDKGEIEKIIIYGEKKENIKKAVEEKFSITTEFGG